jgi:hypothetical protein
MTRVAINQSNYVPWKGYFDLINDVDVFLFYDDVQFTVRDWRNRNRVKTPQGGMWLTVPVGSNTNRLICEVEISDHSWQERHWRTLRHCYARAPYFRRFAPFLEEVYRGRIWRNLSKLNQFLITHIAREFLGIRTEIRDARDYGVTSTKQQRILDLLQEVGATEYHSGAAAQAYLDPECFRERGIGLVWKNYDGYPEYAQLHPPFRHAVSIVDLLFHVGPDAPYYVWGWRCNAAGLSR